MKLLELFENFVVNVPQGNRNTDVADVQKSLIAFGYTLPKHGVDGIRGPETSAAVRKFQQDNNLKVDGIPGIETVTKINDLLKQNPNIAKKLTKSTADDIRPGKFLSSLNVSGQATGGIGATRNATVALKYFISKGWSEEQAAGIVGNLQQESFADLKINAVGDNGNAYGIAQWHPPRQEIFKTVFGKDIRQSNFQEQLEFINWELNNSEKVAGNILKATTTTEQAAWVVDRYYERSNGQHRQHRINNALALLPNNSVL